MEQTQFMPVLKEPESKKKGNRKLLIILFLLFAVLLAILFFNSSISKISSIGISGQQYIGAAEVEEASGIVVGDAFFGTSSSTIEARIEKLSSVSKATVTKNFPGEVQIKVEEYSSVGYELSPQGEITALLSNGTTLSMQGRDFVVDKPVLAQWPDKDPYKVELTKVLGELPPAIIGDFSEIIPIPSTAYPDRIKIYTRTQFEVITAISFLKEKAPKLSAVIEQQAPGKVTMLLADTYSEYQSDFLESEDSNEKETTQ
ncbi:cell division protein FtsQ/DivIB [Paenibacillus sp. GCM10012307]|uniref:Cell division protein DivIB n=1 Tax=Paenibacillus roseus TaxID=2798579 RepID=A0A934MQH6_9BACL|nr:FtsQ-type POTRA domain-containing protein [Paenibacillus roseus]MBJ6363161.1 FtsQ-type POTRA domain-containing protein [Paenibacillus roseus]